MIQRQRRTRPVFRDIPAWLKAYKGHSLSTNSPQFHYYTARDNSSQPVTLRITSQNESHPMTMYYNKESLICQSQREKDESPLKDFSGLVQSEHKYKQQIELSKEDVINDSSWVKKYEPRRFIDLLTDEYINRNVLTWMKSWDEIVFKKKVPKTEPAVKGFFKRGQNYNKSYFMTQDYNYKKLILLAGPPGCGKTTIARVVARHCGYHYQQINASDDRSGKALIHKIHNLVTHQTVGRQQKPTCVIIDEVDGALDSDSNGIKDVLNYLQTGVVPGQIKKEKNEKKKDNKNQKGKVPQKPQQKEKDEQNQRKTKVDRPVIFICNDPFVRGLKDLRGRAIVVYFGQLNQDRVVKRLKEIGQKQTGGYVENELLIKICQLCNNDVRSSVGVLQLAVRFQKTQNQSIRDTINRLHISISKDVVASSNEFLLKLQSSKTSNQTHIYTKYQHYLQQHGNPTLMFNTFFHNLPSHKNVYYRLQPATRLYRQILEYDVNVNQNHGQIDQFSCLLYCYFKTAFKAEDHKKIEFPSVFFERISKQKSNKALLEKIMKEIPPYIKIFTPPNLLVQELFHLFWLTMQTSSPKEEDVLRCVYNMLTYGIKLAPRNAPHLFTPEFDQFLTFGTHKPQILLSLTTRNLMQQNYQFLKIKSQLIQQSFVDGRQDYETVIHQLKRNRRRNRQLQGCCLKYKYLQGTGTQIKYDLKIGHFFQRSAL